MLEGGADASSSASASLAGKRGSNWASLATHDRPIPLRRPIRLECAADEFRLLDDGGGRVETRVPIGVRTADSIDLLRQVTALVSGAGWSIGNVDCSVVCEQPKLAPARAAMQERLSAAVGADVSVKGRRAESLGALGPEDLAKVLGAQRLACEVAELPARGHHRRAAAGLRGSRNAPCVRRDRRGGPGQPRVRHHEHG
jgi:hypothetical protein